MKRNKGFVLMGVVLVLVIALFFAVQQKKVAAPNSPLPVKNVGATSFKDATYTIEGKEVTLKNGTSQVSLGDGGTQVTTATYFGNEAYFDFDTDGRKDVVFLLTQNTGGSGTFYYVAAALQTADGYKGTRALFLGDRIAPQTTEIDVHSNITVNFADRKLSDSFATPPSIGKSMRLRLDLTTLDFGLVATDFEGEADPSQMSLTMGAWHWIETIDKNGNKVLPKVTGKFVLTLQKDKTFSLSTDCNGVGGEYVPNKNTITFKNMISTMMFCEGSQESEVTKMLASAESFSFTSKGELIFKLSSGSSMFFR